MSAQRVSLFSPQQEYPALSYCVFERALGGEVCPLLSPGSHIRPILGAVFSLYPDLYGPISSRSPLA